MFFRTVAYWLFCFWGATFLVVIVVPLVVPPEEFYLFYPESAYSHAEYKSSFSKTLEDCSLHFDHLLRGFGGFTIITKLLCTLVCFDEMKLEEADKEQLSRFANLRCVHVLLVKVNTRSSNGSWSAIWRQWYDWEHSNSHNKFSPAICFTASVNVLTR